MYNSQPWTLIGLAVVVSLSIQACGTAGGVTNPLGVPPVQENLSPGASKPLQNPSNSSGSWDQGDSFVLLNPPDGISVTSIVGPDGIPARKLEAAPTVAAFSKDVEYAYLPKSDAPTPDKVLVGTLAVKTVPELHVSVIATPTKSPPGQTSLQATPTGGAPPYSFSWTPSTGLDNATSATPLANPAATTTYTVAVTDNVGQAASASVTVTVFPKGSTFALTVVNTNPDALGGVSDDRGSIVSCFATCSAAYPSGTTVVLATDPGFAPPNWSGCNSVDSTKHCTVVMDANKTVTVSP
jgi:hypothetical protein